MITKENYRVFDALNASLLKGVFKHSVWHARRKWAPTPAMQMGTAVHECLLEPEEFAKNFALFDGDRRTKAGKEAYKEIEASGKTPLAQKDYQQVYDMTRQARLYPEVNELLDGAEVELPLEFEMWGVKCKAQIDLYQPRTGILMDVKTTADITKAKRQFFDMVYDLQMFWYARALHENGRNVDQVKILFMETQFPYTVALYDVPAEVITCGAVRARQAFEKYMEQRCLVEPEMLSGTIELPAYLNHTVEGESPF